MMRGDGFAIFAALLWGVNYPMVKLVLESVPEKDFLLIRFSLAVLLFVVYLLARGENLRISAEHRTRVLMLGVFGVGVYNIVWTCGIHKTTAANAAILISASPIFTGLYALWTGEEKITVSKVTGTVMAFTGICAIINWTPGSELKWDSQAFSGNILVLAGSALFSMYAVLAKPLLRHYSPVKLTTLAMIGGLPAIVLYGLMQEGQLSLPDNPSVWSGFAYIIIMGTVVAFVFWYKGIQRTSPFKTVIFHYFVPVVSMIVETVFLGSVINLERVIGGILVFAGLLAIKREEVMNRAGVKSAADG